MRKRKQRMQSKIGRFLKEYGRKRRRQLDPNDRHYDRNFEKELKRLRPEELDHLLHGDDDAEVQRPTTSPRDSE